MHRNKQKMFSKSCEYGIRAALYIAQQSHLNKRSGIKDIAKGIDSPVAFTAKILQQLVKHRIVNSVKGPSGGFGINLSDLDSIKLSHIVSAIDGDNIYSGCGLGLKACNAMKPCPIHESFKAIRSDLKKMLETTSLQLLMNGLDTGLTFLKR